MSYVCRKCLTFSGTKYEPGDFIPDGVILPNRVRSLMAVGMISEVGEKECAGTPVVNNSQPVIPVSELSTISIPVKGENGDITLEVTAEEIQTVFSILQMNASEGITEVGKIESDNALILIHATDSRKTVQNAAKERADILSSADDNKNAPIGNNEATTGSDDTSDTADTGNPPAE